MTLVTIVTKNLQIEALLYLHTVEWFLKHTIIINNKWSVIIQNCYYIIDQY